MLEEDVEAAADAVLNALTSLELPPAVPSDSVTLRRMIGECVINSRGSTHIKLSNSRDHCEESCSVEFAVGDGPPMTTLISCSLVASSPLWEKSVSQRNGPEGRAPSTDVVTPSNVTLNRLEPSSRRAETIMAVPVRARKISTFDAYRWPFPYKMGM